MSLPHRPPLSKPPPKALPPKALPSATARPDVPTAVAIAAQPAVAPQAVARPSPLKAATVPSPAAVVRRTPSPSAIELSHLTPSMAAMMEAIGIYEDLLVEENAMLRAGDSTGVANLLDRKMHATRLYQERQRTVLSDPDATRSLAPDQRAQVVTMVRSLEELAKENTVLLKANMSAIEQLFEVINLAARKMRKREVAYSKAGVIRDYHHAHNTSLAYNHTV